MEIAVLTASTREDNVAWRQLKRADGDARIAVFIPKNFLQKYLILNNYFIHFLEFSSPSPSATKSSNYAKVASYFYDLREDHVRALCRFNF
ncbi:hypothetical protein ACLB1M_20870 [Escherichia coli]